MNEMLGGTRRRGGADLPRAARSSGARSKAAILVAAILLAGAVVSPAARAQTINSLQTFGGANTAQITAICAAQKQGAASGLGANLATICRTANTLNQPLDVSGAGIISATPLSTAHRESEKESELTAASEKGSGGSADMQTYRLFDTISVFAAAGGDSLTHHASDFEEPYHAADAFVTVGAGAHPVDWLRYGVGFTYQYLDGNFVDHGSFRTDSYNPFLFATLVPFDGAFIDTSLGYTRLSNERRRGANVALSPNIQTLSGGIATGTPGENAYTGSVQAGYDRQSGILTIGPRLGLTAATWRVDPYTESGQTGLELHYDAFDQSSIQSSLGAAASAVITTGFGAVLPTLSASWIHEFEAYARPVHARFVEAPGFGSFSYNTETPAGDYGVLALHVVAALPGRLRPFLDVRTIVGNGNYESYGGTLGLTYTW